MASSRDGHSSTATARKNWDRSQDWKNTGTADENKDWKPAGGSWRASSAADPSVKLETVHEDEDDAVSEARSENTTVPIILDYEILTSAGRTSSGSVSDPGDSYGGREYHHHRKADDFS